MTLRTERIRTLKQVRAFLDGSGPVEFTLNDRDSAHVFVRRSLDRLRDRRRKPDPQGRPGFVRVDTVHQGDGDGEKGLHLVNVVDQVTQFEHIGAVSRITELFMLPVLEDLLTAFPFPVEGFHADNGSEYVNHHVAGMLNKLHIGEFTKSRPRHSNDNALVESKNGAIVRKWLGRAHIPQDRAPAVNDFLRHRLCPFLNFHRPRLFASETTGPRGRTRKRYLQRDVATPYDRLKSLPGAEGFLKPGLTFEQLDRSVRATAGLEAAKTVRQARRDLFRALGPAASSVARVTMDHSRCAALPLPWTMSRKSTAGRPRATGSRVSLQAHVRIGKD